MHFYLKVLALFILGLAVHFQMANKSHEQGCHECHLMVQKFLDSSFEEVRASLAARKEPVPDFYTPQLHNQTQLQIRRSLEIFNKALDNYTQDQLCISYNGGKDCLVMLVLYLAAIYEHSLKCPQTIKAVYINAEETFPEQSAFLEQSAKQYNLDLVQIRSTMKEGLQQYLENDNEVEGIMVGIRRIDPYGDHLEAFQRTDGGWPDFERIHPVLEWTTLEVWWFIRGIGAPYCSLYDDGYTSLGGIGNTIPNPLLKQDDGTFLPAYMLNDDEHERLSRVQAQKL